MSDTPSKAEFLTRVEIITAAARAKNPYKLDVKALDDIDTVTAEVSKMLRDSKIGPDVWGQLFEALGGGIQRVYGTADTW